MANQEIRMSPRNTLFLPVSLTSLFLFAQCGDPGQEPPAPQTPEAAPKYTGDLPDLRRAASCG
jgi:hypothetical protein